MAESHHADSGQHETRVRYRRVTGEKAGDQSTCEDRRSDFADEAPPETGIVHHFAADRLVFVIVALTSESSPYVERKNITCGER